MACDVSGYTRPTMESAPTGADPPVLGEGGRFGYEGVALDHVIKEPHRERCGIVAPMTSRCRALDDKEVMP